MKHRIGYFAENCQFVKFLTEQATPFSVFIKGMKHPADFGNLLEFKKFGNLKFFPQRDISERTRVLPKLDRSCDVNGWVTNM